MTPSIDVIDIEPSHWESGVLNTEPRIVSRPGAPSEGDDGTTTDGDDDDDDGDSED